MKDPRKLMKVTVYPLAIMALSVVYLAGYGLFTGYELRRLKAEQEAAEPQIPLARALAVCVRASAGVLDSIFPAKDQPQDAVARGLSRIAELCKEHVEYVSRFPPKARIPVFEWDPPQCEEDQTCGGVPR